MNNTQQTAAIKLFSSILPGVVEVSFSRGVDSFSVLGTQEMALAAVLALPGCEIVDWSADSDFVLCGTPFEVYVPVNYLEQKLEQAIAEGK